jgi:hypothetical protein
VRARGPAGVTWRGRGQTLFPVATAPAAGNNLPGITGAMNVTYRPAPGYWHVGGQLGDNDGYSGPDPRAPKMSPHPDSSQTDAWGQGQVAPRGGPFAGRQSFNRYGLQGFNDKLTVKDRHAYWDSGHQRTGLETGSGGGLPNTYNDPLLQPPRPELRLVNRTVSFQIGSDATRNQDDLTRQYTWLGEQGAPWTPVNGGVPGLYQPYGTRGGVPFPIVSPVEQGQPGDGPRLVNGGPPHGLHSQTPWKGGGQLIGRYMSTPQMRPVRLDRPSNSPQAGQSYSQTVRPQGASGVRPSRSAATRAAGPMQHTGRGWGGRQGGS